MSSYTKTTSSFLKRNVRYSDLSINFGKNPFNSDVNRITEVDSVKRAIKSLVLTNRYERLLDPQIGGNIRALLFEPISALTTTVLEDYITDTIKNYEPRAILDSVVATPDYDRNSYEVTIQFRINSVEQPQVLSVALERVR
jgi:phage baseplate assembly protein W